MGILIAYYDPLYHLNNQVFFIAQMAKSKDQAERTRN